MVSACGKNRLVLYGQNGVDGQSQWGTGTRETEVRLDGWCKGGLRQQRNDGAVFTYTYYLASVILFNKPYF